MRRLVLAMEHSHRAADSREQERRGALPVVADLGARFAVAPHVVLTEEVRGVLAWHGRQTSDVECATYPSRSHAER